MSAPPPPKRRGTLMTFVLMAFVFIILFQPGIRDTIGRYVGIVLYPAIGFGGKFPVLTVTIAGTLMILLTTLIRHFTTDWLKMARTQAVLKHFQKEMMKARKEQNTYRLKKLQDMQPKIMETQQEVQMATLRTMPLTLIVVIPLFAWLFMFIDNLDYWWFSAPWNPEVNLFTKEGIPFGTSLLPHWILLYSLLSIPLGALAQKAMKFLSWRERWKPKHPEVHE